MLFSNKLPEDLFLPSSLCPVSPQRLILSSDVSNLCLLNPSGADKYISSPVARSGHLHNRLKSFLRFSVRMETIVKLGKIQGLEEPLNDSSTVLLELDQWFQVPPNIKITWRTCSSIPNQWNQNLWKWGMGINLFYILSTLMQCTSRVGNHKS